MPPRRASAAVALAGIVPGLGRSPPARSLARDDGSLVEDLTAPHSPWFGAFDRVGQAGHAQRAFVAVCLSLLKLIGLVRCLRH